MRARSHVAVAGVAASLGAVAACSLTTDFSGVSDKPDATSGAEHAVPPSRPAGAPTKGGGVTLFLGVKHFHFAHSNDALKVPGAWQDWGFDLDGLCTSSLAADQKGVCIRRPGATPDMVQDGKACRDNNFGSQIVPKLTVYASAFENDTNDGLGAGTPTWILALDDLGGGADDPYVPGRLYLAARMPDKVRPAWDGTDARKILTSSVKGGKIDDPVITFPRGYLKGHVWVSGEATNLSLSLPIGKAGVLMPLVAQHAVMAFRLKDDHGSVVDGTGQFAGAMPMSSLESFLAPFLASQTTFCPGSSQYRSFMDSLAPFADVSLGAASLQDEKNACDGVSFGIGINLAPIAVPTETAPPESDPPCGTVSDAGSDAAADVGDAATDTRARRDRRRLRAPKDHRRRVFLGTMARQQDSILTSLRELHSLHEQQERDQRELDRRTREEAKKRVEEAALARLREHAAREEERRLREAAADKAALDERLAQAEAEAQTTIARLRVEAERDAVAMAARHAAELAALEATSIRTRKRTTWLLVASSLLAAIVVVLAIVGLTRKPDEVAVPRSTPAVTVTVEPVAATEPAPKAEPVAAPQPSAKPKPAPVHVDKPKPRPEVTVGSTSCARCSGVPLCTCKAGDH